MEKFEPQGIAPGWLICFACQGVSKPNKGLKKDKIHYDGMCQHSLSARVEDLESAEKIMKMLEYYKLVGEIDHKPSVSSIVYIKLGACDDHVAYLERIWEVTQKAGNTISPQILRVALGG